MEQPNPAQPKSDAEQLALAARYREIGISAVTAALFFTGESAPQPPKAPQIDSRFIEAA